MAKGISPLVRISRAGKRITVMGNAQSGSMVHLAEFTKTVLGRGK